MIGVNTLIFQQTIAEQLNIKFLEVLVTHFRDEKENVWFMALNHHSLTNEELNYRFKLNVTENKQKNHSKIELLLAVCGLEFFLYFNSKLWEIEMDSDTKMHKLLEIFITPY